MEAAASRSPFGERRRRSRSQCWADLRTVVGLRRHTMLGCAIVLTVAVVLVAYSPKLAIAIVAIGIGVVVTVDLLERRLTKPRIRSRDEVVKILQEAMDEWSFYDDIAWNDFIRYRIQDTELDEIRSRCARLEQDYPAGESGRVLSQAGEDVLREIIKELEQAR